MPNKKISRRQFIAGGVCATAGLLAGGKLIFAGKQSHPVISGGIVGANSKAGHLLRGFKFPEPLQTEDVPVVIVGAGISGLSAARRLHQNGFSDFVMLELGNETGGNSISGSNDVSAYPWGAHYLPIPDTRLEELLLFLEECGTLIGYDRAGLPLYNEYHLCADPQERLFIHGTWQEGIVPNLGLAEQDAKEMKRFFELADNYRYAKGEDGKDIFTIPVDRSSMSAEAIKLDSISFSEFLSQNKFSSPYLLWYLNYCCRDDYGTTLNNTSAWAGLHYFASRKGRAGNASYNDVLTWPEGNGFLSNKLRDGFPRNVVRARSVVYSVKSKADKTEVLYYNTDEEKSYRIMADKVILATPQYVNKKILADERKMNYDIFSYTPWMVANITLTQVTHERGFELAWDNVFFNSESLGYVNACQQNLNVFEKRKNFTYYLPLTDKEPHAARMEVYGKTHEQWAKLVMYDMESAHKDIATYVECIDVWLWGHGMVRPVPGFVTGEGRKKAKENINNSIFFAHSDLGGISIFEEAFYSGIHAADEVLEAINTNV